jgi:hypothetical protein
MSQRDEDEKPWDWPVRAKPGQVTIRIDLWAQQQAERRAERRLRRQLDPYRLGHWGPIDEDE